MQRQLLLDIRREHPAVWAELALAKLQASGRLHKGLMSPPTIRRLWASQGLDARTVRLRDSREDANGRRQMPPIAGSVYEFFTSTAPAS